jgi:hypothetical protein
MTEEALTPVPFLFMSCPLVPVLINTSQVLYLKYIQYTPETCDPVYFLVEKQDA